MMTSLQKQLQNLQAKLNQENDNHRNHMRSQQTQQTPPQVPPRPLPLFSQSPQHLRRQSDVMSQTNAPLVNRRVHNNNNLQLQLNRPHVIENRRNQMIGTDVTINESNSINAQCLSPRPRPKQLAIGRNNTTRPASPSRMNLHFSPPDDIGMRNNSASDDIKLNEVFKQNNSVLTIDSKKYSAKEEDLQHLCVLGAGSCGHVEKMLHKPSGKIVAVKQMRRSGNNEDNKRIKMDLDILLACHDCPNIVQCYGYLIKDTEVWICMELMSTCFDKLLKKYREPIPEPILGKIAVATVNALNYLKDNHKVIHRDVKPSNILINEKGVVKLCDFGISGRLVDSKAKTRSAGCTAYMAPERIEPPDSSNPSYDVRADVWSLGISLIELATAEFPYKGCSTDFELLTKVVSHPSPKLPSDKPFSPDFCGFVDSCLTHNYKNRPKYKKLLEHNFIQYYEKNNVNVEQWFERFVECNDNTIVE